MRGRVTSEDTVAVFGCGAIGIGVLAAAANLGARVIAIDVDDQVGVPGTGPVAFGALPLGVTIAIFTVFTVAAIALIMTAVTAIGVTVAVMTSGTKALEGM